MRQHVAGHPTYHVNVIKLWTARLPYQSGLRHLPGVPYLHESRPLIRRFLESYTLGVLEFAVTRLQFKVVRISNFGKTLSVLFCHVVFRKVVVLHLNRLISMNSLVRSQICN